MKGQWCLRKKRVLQSHWSREREWWNLIGCFSLGCTEMPVKSQPSPFHWTSKYTCNKTGVINETGITWYRWLLTKESTGWAGLECNVWMVMIYSEYDSIKATPRVIYTGVTTLWLYQGFAGNPYTERTQDTKNLVRSLLYKGWVAGSF